MGSQNIHCVPVLEKYNIESNGLREHIIWKKIGFKSGEDNSEKCHIDPAGLIGTTHRNCNIYVKYLQTSPQKEGMKLVLTFFMEKGFSITLKYYPFEDCTNKIIEDLKKEGFSDVTFDPKKTFEFSYRLIEIFDNGGGHNFPKLSILCDRDFCEIIHENSKKFRKGINFTYFKFVKNIENIKRVGADWQRGFLVTSESKTSGYTIESVLNLINNSRKTKLNLGKTANLTISYITEESQIVETINIISLLSREHNVKDFTINTLPASRKYCNRHLDDIQKWLKDYNHVSTLMHMKNVLETNENVNITLKEIENRRVTKFNCIEFQRGLQIVLNEGVQLHLKANGNLARPHIILFLFNERIKKRDFLKCDLQHLSLN